MSGFQPMPASPDWSLVNRDTGAVVVNDLRVADSFGSKLLGLQFRATLPVGRALLLVKTPSVHTFWMRFALDLTFIGVDGGVLGVRRAVRPWRITVGPRGTHATLETKAGWIELDAGDRLVAVCANDEALQRRGKSLWFFDPIAATKFKRQERPRPKESEHQHA